MGDELLKSVDIYFLLPLELESKSLRDDLHILKVSFCIRSSPIFKKKNWKILILLCLLENS